MTDFGKSPEQFSSQEKTKPFCDEHKPLVISETLTDLAIQNASRHPELVRIMRFRLFAEGERPGKDYDYERLSADISGMYGIPPSRMSEVFDLCEFALEAELDV